MSQKNAVNFLVAVQKDAAKYDRLATMSGPAVTQLAAEMGFPCALDDLKSALKEAKQTSHGLSDQELEHVAGGVGGGQINSIRISCDCRGGLQYPKSWDSHIPGDTGPGDANREQ